MQLKKLAIFISGRGSNMEAILSSWQKDQLPIDPVVVISSNPFAEGLEIAQKFGIPTLISERKKGEQTLSEYGDNLLKIITPFDPDLIALAGFMEIVAPNFINAFKGKILNIHPSLLPSFPGLHPHLQAIKAGVKISGCTVHLVNDKVDSGAIIAQAAVPVFPTDSEENLSARILKQEHLLYPAVIAGIAAGQIQINNSQISINYDFNGTTKKETLTSKSLATWGKTSLTMNHSM